MNFSSRKIEYGTRKVNANYTIEMYNDLMSMVGVNFDAEKSVIEAMLREEKMVERENKIDQLFNEE